MNKQVKAKPLYRKNNISKSTWQKIFGILGFLTVILMLVGVFALTTFAESATKALQGGDVINLTCEGRGFQIDRESRNNVILTCRASSGNTPLPTAVPPIVEPPIVPTAAPPVEPPVEPSPVEATYYVAPNGNDNNSGVEQQPFRTIQHAVDLAEAGDTILVRGGTYVEKVSFTQSGTQNQPITLAAYPNEEPIIDGAYELPSVPNSGWAKCNETVSPPTCFHYRPLVEIAASHIIVDGFEIRHSLGRGVWVHNSDYRVENIIIRNTEIHDHRNAGIKMLEADNVLFESNRVWHNSNYATHDRPGSELGWSHAVNALSSTHVTYQNNVIYNNYGEGIGTGRGSSNITIIENEIYDNRAIQVYIHRTHDVVVANNQVYCTGDKNFLRGGNLPTGIIVNNEIQFEEMQTVDNASVKQNIVIGCRQGFAIWGGGGSTKIGSQNVTVEGNTFVNATSMPDKEEAVAIAVLKGVGHHNINVLNNIIYQEEFKVAYVVTDPAIQFENNMWSQTPPENVQDSGDVIGEFELVNPNVVIVPGQLNSNNYLLIDG